MSRRTTPPAAWMTERNLARGRRLWDDGVTATDIAGALGDGCTKSALLGKAHRLGWPPRPSPVGPNAGMVVPRKAEQPHRSRNAPPTRKLPKREVVPGRRETCKPEPLAVPTLSFSTCQWIEGADRRTWRFCTEPATRGAWCGEHHRRVFIRRNLLEAAA